MLRFEILTKRFFSISILALSSYTLHAGCGDCKSSCHDTAAHAEGEAQCEKPESASKEQCSTSVAEAKEQAPTGILVSDGNTSVSESFLLGSVTANVSLIVGRLEMVDNGLKGSYKVEVDMSDIPAALRMLASEKDESGTITLKCPEDNDLSAVAAQGGKLEGKGYCEAKDEYRQVKAEVIPAEDGKGGKILLNIDSGFRILDFECDYTLEYGEVKVARLTQPREETRL